ncbi:MULTISPECIES: iron-containing alcohol dehydrogenase [unclassified Clostridium]|uniref:iron-containing alcohol dehydrogenase n=1 Tax=unclassified Clostridium TaxID=2614128 RepID=UPI0002973EF6|nr:MULTISPECIES: iron-containing alcohol dehydrogenase [unclassified Clostridium]EKQ58094.1 MAG: alcohol dehydrogenase, class IV [Clostridium sp. Maddingley MBC34-26]
MKTLRFNGDAIVTGVNSMEYLKEIKYNKAFIVTGGQSMFNSGVIDKVKEYLGNDEDRIFVYSGIGKNPTTEEVKKGIESIKKFEPDLVVAVGGGSPIDAAKIIALVYEYPELKVENLTNCILPEKRYKTKFVAIPSTSGTASEVTHVSVLTYEDVNLKLGIKSPSLRPDVAILDGNIPMTLPYNIAAETGMDALTHAIEAYINKTGDDFTEVLAKGAIEGLIEWLPIACNNKDIESRQKVHNYQSMAGMAFSNSGLGMVHGVSHAFGGKYNLAHGLTNAVILPYAMKYNSRDKEVSKKFSKLSAVIGTNIIEKVAMLNKELGIPNCIKDTGISEEDFNKDYELLVKNSMCGSTVANPIKIDIEVMKEFVKTVYYGSEIDY